MSRLIVGPFNRVEGDLEVRLDIDAEHVASGEVSAGLYRGFERILEGRRPQDAMVIAPRICGICSISQSLAATRALADVMGLTPARNGQIASNILSATENLADHLSHFYLFFMPDFARDVYRDRAWFDDVEPRFRAMDGAALAEVLPARARLLNAVGLLAGKWPHSLALQPGGTTDALSQGGRVRLLSILADTRRFLERVIFGDRLEAVIEILNGDALRDWALGRTSDFATFVRVAYDLDLHALGRRDATFMSYGAYGGEGGFLFPRGVGGDEVRGLDPASIVEDTERAWLTGSAVHPQFGDTIPDLDKDDGYTWCKAPRLGGQVMEVGALARQVIAGHPLLRDLSGGRRSDVLSRVVGRMIECARLLVAMESWADEFDIGAPFCTQGEMPKDGRGVGLVEAARGGLGHWLTLRDGRIHRYQIIAPTTWNFSPRDADGVPGALEQALVGAPVLDGETSPVSVQHIVRSFDPCMACTVH